MKTTATIRVGIDMGIEAASKLDATRRAYVVALNMTSAVAFEGRIKGGVDLHHATYRDVREATKLPANLVCSARAVVAEAYTRDPTRTHRFRDHSAMRYDARTLRVDLAKGLATLSTLDGRVGGSLILCGYHRRFMDGSWTFPRGAAVKRSGKAWVIHPSCKEN